MNPRHLFLGTNADNMHDKTRKGRQVKGIEVNTSKLNEDQVREIRQRYADGERSADLSAEYGVNKNMIWKIVTRQNWKHVR